MLGILVRPASRLFYGFLAKPRIFKKSPDKAHEDITIIGSKVQQSSFLRFCLRVGWSYRNKRLRQEFAGLSFINPIGLSAGFDKEVQLLPLMESVGFGFATGGSVTSKAYKGNARPWYYRLPKEKSLVVNAGLPSSGSLVVAKHLKNSSSIKNRKIPLVLSVGLTNDKSICNDPQDIEDYIQTISRVHKLVDILEINISCPNTCNGEPFTEPTKLKRLLEAMDELKIKVPVTFKMPSDLAWKDFDKLLNVLVEHKVWGVTICNLVKDSDRKLLPEGVRGGLSGKPVWEISNNLIKKTYQKYGDKLVIIGVGGVSSAKDAYTKIRLGASLVGMITGLIYEGPQVVGEINHGLTKLLKQDGFTNVSEAVGIDANK